MKVNYLSFLDPYKFSGGGEMISRALIDEGRKRGHLINVSSVSESNFMPDPDIFWLTDINNCPQINRGFGANIIESIIKNYPYIHMDNAYVDVCQIDYLPCNGDVTICGDSCSRFGVIDLYSQSFANVFLSPLHRRVHQKILGKNVVGDFIECMPMIDRSLFYDRNLGRDITYLYLGVICEAKGYYKIRERFGEEDNFLFIGDNITGEQLFGKHLPKITYDEVPVYMSRAKNFVHLPRWPEPQGRSVVEAALCGCNLIANDNCGATSFDFNLIDEKKYRDSEKRFWHEVERLFKCVI